MAMTEQEKEDYVRAKKQIDQWLGSSRSRSVDIGNGMRAPSPKEGELSTDDREVIADKAIDLWSKGYGCEKKWPKTKGVPDSRVCAGRALATFRSDAKRKAERPEGAIPKHVSDPTDAIGALVESRRSGARAGLYGASWKMRAKPFVPREPTKEEKLEAKLGRLAYQWQNAFERGELSSHGEAVFRVLSLAAHAPTEKEARTATFRQEEHVKCNRALLKAATKAQVAMEALILGPRSRKQSAQELVGRVGWRRRLPLEQAASRIVSGLCIWNPLADLLKIGPDDERCFERVHEALCKADGSDDIATAKAVLKALGYRGKLHETFDFIRHRKRSDSAEESEP